MKLERQSLFSGIAVLTLLFHAPFFAYAAQFESRDTAGVEERRFNEERQEKSGASVELSAPVVEAQKPAASTDPQGPLFKVTEIRLSGNYSIPDGELLPFARPLLDGDTSLGAIRNAVEEMKRYYRSKGYPAAYIYVPPQQVQGGVLKIEVLEGRLGEVRVGPTKFFSESLLKRQFRLKSGDVLRFEPLRRDLARINRSRDLKVKTLLVPGKETGTTDVEVEVEEKYPIHFGGVVNNSGTENTGEPRYGLNLSHENLTGNLDRLDGSVQWGKGVTSLGAGYNFLVRPDYGTRAGYSFSYAQVDVGGAFAVLDVEGDARTHRFYLTQPLYESEGLDIDGTVGIDAKSAENRLLGQVFGKDELRTPNAEIQMIQNDAGGSTFFVNRVNWGIPDFIGSSRSIDPAASRAGTGGEYLTYRGTLARFQKLPGDMLLSVRGTAQLSPDALPPSEQLSVGGARSVRGYQEGEYLGDHGGYVSTDLYFPLVFIPDSWALYRAKEPLKKQLQGILFADAGTATLRRPLAGEKKEKDLAGAGFGVRARLYERLNIRLEYAFPLGDRPFDNRDNAFYFTVAYDLF